MLNENQKAAQKKYYLKKSQTPEFKLKRSKLAKDYYNRNKEIVKEKTKNYAQNDKEGKAERDKKYREANLERCKYISRNNTLKSKYGLTIEEVEKMKLSQNNCCAICNKEEIKLVVDHNHESGKVRGMLCHHCNISLGFYEKFIKNPKWIDKAESYLNS